MIKSFRASNKNNNSALPEKKTEERAGNKISETNVYKKISATRPVYENKKTNSNFFQKIKKSLISGESKKVEAKEYIKQTSALEKFLNEKRENKMKKMQAKPDFIIIIIAVFLSLFGLLMIYSASSYTAALKFGDEFYYVKKQAVALVFGLIVMAAMFFVKSEKINKFKYIILLISYVLLILVLTPLGTENYGAQRWLNLGFMTIQPSEIAKFALMIFVAGVFSGSEKINEKKFILTAIATAIMLVLIMLEPNMSITMCVLFCYIIMLFVAGVKIKHFILMLIPLLVGIGLLIVLEPYRMARLMAFIDPWQSPKGEGYQLIQSLYALGSGGLFGVGLFNSRQKYLFLPFSESDFILSVIGEELGFFGLVIILSLYFMLVIRGIRVAMRADNRFNCFLASGITTVIAVQTMLNVAVVSGAIPPTGLPLPFISSGGSSLVSFLAAIGILANISTKSKTPHIML